MLHCKCTAGLKTMKAKSMRGQPQVSPSWATALSPELGCLGVCRQVWEKLSGSGPSISPIAADLPGDRRVFPRVESFSQFLCRRMRCPCRNLVFIFHPLSGPEITRRRQLLGAVGAIGAADAVAIGIAIQSPCPLTPPYNCVRREN